MAVDLPPMPPMPDTPILSGLSLPQLPSVPSIPLPAMPTLAVPQLELTGDLMGAASVADGFGSAVPPEVQADITAALAKIGADPALLFLVPIILAGAAVAKAVAEAPDQPYPALEYDAQAARRYFRVRPGVVANRALELGSASAGFGAKLAQDFLAGELERKAPQRAEELAELLTELGPTFIKLGQSASIRTDLLPAAYCAGLQKLQDKARAPPPRTPSLPSPRCTVHCLQHPLPSSPRHPPDHAPIRCRPSTKRRRAL